MKNSFRYNRYSEVMSRLRFLPEDEQISKTAEQALSELEELLKKHLPKSDALKVYRDPQVDRGDILVIEYNGYPFEFLLKR